MRVDLIEKRRLAPSVTSQVTYDSSYCDLRIPTFLAFLAPYRTTPRRHARADAPIPRPARASSYYGASNRARPHLILLGRFPEPLRRFRHALAARVEREEAGEGDARDAEEAHPRGGRRLRGDVVRDDLG